jgi:23S rRNA (guanosine2251-2'-O)-methyltransferase
VPRAANRDLLYGRNAVIEALGGPRAKHRLWIAASVREDDRIRSLISVATAAKIEIDRCPREMLDDLTSRANHQGVALEAGPFAYATLDDIIERQGTVLILDHLQDPQNFGTLMRAAEAAAVGGVVIPNDRTVAVTPAVVNASAGAVEHLAVAQVPNLARTADELKAKGWWVVGLDTGPDAVELFSTDLPSPVALIVGAEGSGIGQNVRRRCDLIVSLPLRGKVASLNAATAGAIALFDLVRRA